jgi:hypothetical protein
LGKPVLSGARSVALPTSAASPGVEHCAEQDQILAALRSKCTDAEFSSYKRMVGRSMGIMLIEIIKPIVDKHPDLKPAQREGGQSGNPATRRLSSKKQVERDGSVMADLEREPETARNRREVAASSLRPSEGTIPAAGG